MADCADFKDGDWETFAMKCNRPGLAQDGVNLVQQLPFVFSVKSKRRLTTAGNLARFWNDTGRPIEADMMRFSTVGEVFEIQHDAIKLQVKKNDDHDIPKCAASMKNEAFPKWLEATDTYLSLKYGARDCPLSWITRENAQRPAVLPPLEAGKPYTEDGGSISADMVAFYSHDHPLYGEDDKAVYAVLEDATRGTRFHASVTMHSRGRNGRAAYHQLKSNHLSDDKWDSVIDKCKAQLLKKWDGTGTYTLESHAEKTRAAYIDMEAASVHVTHQMPDDRNRVKSFLTSVENCQDPSVQAAISAVKLPTNNLTEDLEGAITLLLPTCPVSKKGATRRRGNISDSKVTFDLPKTTANGLQVRWYEPDEWWAMEQSERDEIDAARPPIMGKSKEFKRRKRNGDKKNGKRNLNLRHNRKIKRKVAAAVRSELKKTAGKESHNQKTLREIASTISELIPDSNDQTSKKPSATIVHRQVKDDLAMAAAIKINKIIKEKPS